MRRREHPDRRGLALMVALALCGAVSILHRHEARTRGGDRVTGVVRDMALVPAQEWSVRGGRWWHDTITACFEAPALARHNRELTAQVHGLQEQNKDLRGAQAENIRLRHLLRFGQKSPVPLLAAEVLAIEPNFQSDTLLLARGISDDVRPRTVALAPNGSLVGQVVDVSVHSCSVLLLTDTGSSVGAQVMRRTAASAADALADPVALPLPKLTVLKNGPIGVCQGGRAGRLFLTYLPAQADVQVGDLVTTSGLGGVFPKGLAIGTVQSVTVDSARSVKSALLRPAADFDHLEEVFLRVKPLVLPAALP